MNRWLIAAVVGLMSVGCAVGVADPQPPPDPGPVRKAPPPAQPYSGELTEVNGDSTPSAGNDLDVPAVPIDIRPVPGK